MKSRLLHIICCLIGIAGIVLSCSKKESDDILPVASKAELVLDLQEGSDADNREMVKKIRFIIFKNASSNGPRVDVNELVEIKTDEQKAVTEIEASVLEVTANNDLMVAVVINEPIGLKAQLDAIYHQGNLEDIVFDIANIMNNGNITEMPMIGVIRDIAVSKEERKNIAMVVERAVARVDIYLEALPGSVETGYTKNQSSVTVHNLSYGSYFAMGNVDNDTRDNADPLKNYGKVMKDVTTMFDKTWTPTSSSTWSYTGNYADDRRLLCSFYTAERLFKSDYSDRIAVSMSKIKKADMETGISNQDIEKVSKDGVTQDFVEIRRNNVYQITAQVSRVLEMTFSVKVEPWETLNVDIPIN